LTFESTNIQGKIGEFQGYKNTPSGIFTLHRRADEEIPKRSHSATTSTPVNYVVLFHLPHDSIHYLFTFFIPQFNCDGFIMAGNDQLRSSFAPA